LDTWVSRQLTNLVLFFSFLLFVLSSFYRGQRCTRTARGPQNTFYSKRTHSIIREHILSIPGAKVHKDSSRASLPFSSRSFRSRSSLSACLCVCVCVCVCVCERARARILFADAHPNPPVRGLNMHTYTCVREVHMHTYTCVREVHMHTHTCVREVHMHTYTCEVFKYHARERRTKTRRRIADSLMPHDTLHLKFTDTSQVYY